MAAACTASSTEHYEPFELCQGIAVGALLYPNDEEGAFSFHGPAPLEPVVEEALGRRGLDSRG
mgnify:CR=1 FL=1